MKKIALIASIAITAGLTSCNPDPSVSFSMDKTEAVPGEVVMFTNSSVDAYDVRWDFGDGGYSEVENPTYAYAEPGSYTITLQATDKKSKDLYTSTATIEVAYDEYTQWEMDREAEREEVTDALLGEWKASYTRTADAAGWDEEYTYDVEIFDEGSMIISDLNDEENDPIQDQPYASYWEFISGDYINFMGNTYNIDIKSSTITLTRKEDFGSTTISHQIILD